MCNLGGRAFQSFSCGLSCQGLASVIKALDDNSQLIRQLSHDLQVELAAERAANDKNVSRYEPGDLVLFNPREKPSDHLSSKLSTDWLGPYEVIQQVKNDVGVKHIVLHTEAVIHVSRLKPFSVRMKKPYLLPAMTNTSSKSYELISILAILLFVPQ